MKIPGRDRNRRQIIRQRRDRHTVRVRNERATVGRTTELTESVLAPTHHILSTPDLPVQDRARMQRPRRDRHRRETKPVRRRNQRSRIRRIGITDIAGDTQLAIPIRTPTRHQTGVHQRTRMRRTNRHLHRRETRQVHHLRYHHRSISAVTHRRTQLPPTIVPPTRHPTVIQQRTRMTDARRDRPRRRSSRQRHHLWRHHRSISPNTHARTQLALDCCGPNTPHDHPPTPHTNTPHPPTPTTPQRATPPPAMPPDSASSYRHSSPCPTDRTGCHQDTPHPHPTSPHTNEPNPPTPTPPATPPAATPPLLSAPDSPCRPVVGRRPQLTGGVQAPTGHLPIVQQGTRVSTAGSHRHRRVPAGNPTTDGTRFAVRSSLVVDPN